MIQSGSRAPAVGFLETGRCLTLGFGYTRSAEDHGCAVGAGVPSRDQVRGLLRCVWYDESSSALCPCFWCSQFELETFSCTLTNSLYINSSQTPLEIKFEFLDEIRFRSVQNALCLLLFIQVQY